MNVIIPAAGKGTRLTSSHTDNCPKCLLEVNGRPLLYYLLANLKKLKVSEVIIVTGYLSGMIEDFVSNNPDFPNVQCIYNNRYETTNNIVSLSMSKEFWNEDFCIIESDLLLRFDLLQQLINSETTCLFIDKSKTFDQIDMKAKINNHNLLYLDKNLPKSETSGEFFGLSRWSPMFAAKFLNEIEQLINQSETSILYDFAIRQLAQRIDLPVRYCPPLSWYEIDNMNDYKNAGPFIIANF